MLLDKSQHFLMLGLKSDKICFYRYEEILDMLSGEHHKSYSSFHYPKKYKGRFAKHNPYLRQCEDIAL